MSSDQPIAAVVVQDQHNLPAHRSPRETIDRAVEIANALSDIIKKQGLSKKFNANSDDEYVFVDGWIALGALMELSIEEDSVTESSPGEFVAHVSIKDRSGNIVSKGSGMCGRDESSWRSRPKYAIRSMSITRAVGKAYRNKFSWIMVMAGYKATPAEEMPDITVEAAPSKDDKSVKYLGTIEEQEGLSKWIAEQHPEIPEAKYFEIHDKLKGRPKAHITKVLKEVAHV